jgi:preprotein translocase subunit SecG
MQAVRLDDELKNDSEGKGTRGKGRLPVRRGKRSKIMQNLTFLLSFLFVLIGIVVGFVLFARHWRSNEVKLTPQTPIQFAQVVVEEDVRSTIGLSIVGLMLTIFSLISAFKYFRATNAFEEMAALLFWIGNNTFWGIFAISGAITRKQTYVVYSELALSMENNIARLEKLQEQTSSVNAVAEAIAQRREGGPL